MDRRVKPAMTDQAAAAAACRATGSSLIGRLISADRMPSRMNSHQIASYEPVRSNNRPPSHTPRKPPTWWLKKAKPASMVSQRVPNISATSPEVGGTVDSHNKPVTAPKISVEVVVAGNKIKATME